MKTIPPVCPEPEGQKYWRSVSDLSSTPEFQQMVEREFPQGASELNDPVSRRNFVKLMSASALLAGIGLTGCRRPEEKILPFSKQPHGYIHGKPDYFASARPIRGSAIPLLVKSNDGRPTKVEGNADHPAYLANLSPEELHAKGPRGGTDLFTQASVLNAYDPDRAMRFLKGGKEVQAAVALDYLSEFAKNSLANEGDGVCFLLDHSSSPSRQRLQKEISAKYKQVRWYSYEPVDLTMADQAASALYYHDSFKVEHHLERAHRILSLDCDFVGSEQETYRLMRGFTDGRRVESAKDDMNRLYIVEGVFSLTGANADHRLRVAPSQIVCFAARFLMEVQKATGGKAVADLAEVSARYKFTEKDEKWIAECVKDLVENRQKCVVLAGYRQPLVVHVMAHLMNQMLGNFGSTVSLYPTQKPEEGSISKLVERLNSGKVSTLVIVGGNPVYNAPADLDFAAAAKKAKEVIRLAAYEDETTAVATWQYPAAHYLESWGDVRTGDGTLTAVQPLIEPLFNGVRELEFLARIGGLETTKAYDIVRATFQAEVFGGKPADHYSEEIWKKFLHDGFVAGTAGRPSAPDFQQELINKIFAKVDLDSAPSASQLEVVFQRDYKVDDGRYNNNGWLQELPDPITKMTWDNVIVMSYKTGKELGLVVRNLENNRLKVPVISVEVQGRKVEGPVWFQPGMADYTVGLALGYGRVYKGRIGAGIGYNAYLVRTAHAPYIAAGAKVANTGKIHPLATTQDHWAMEGRPIIREANLEQFRKKPDFAKAMQMEEPSRMPHENPDGRLYPNPLDTAKDVAVHWWGMAIDLNQCLGCSACMVACQSENNVPIVGKEQVTNNREMHWLRIDRYYTSSLPWAKSGKPWNEDKDVEAQLESHMADPQMITQPMLCQHCEKAPCENVCPVNATVHDQEGLNVMVYNRCVGTRYCSNNCPYKVRRFNYFDYNKRTLQQLREPYPTPLLHSTEGEWDMARWAKSPESPYRPADEWELLKLVKNPDVTVRMRGVMEKCTFCVQRIEQAKIAQKVKARASAEIEVPDGAFTTACAQACPTDAIVFGNIKDPNSRVSKLKAQERDYAVLEFLATKPRLTYLAKLRNPNPAIEDAFAKDPGSLQEYSSNHHENLFEGHEAVEPGDHRKPTVGHEPGEKGGAH
jgi:molybdopterin-containing oxidoreductase family iron-sulfur binding subunit